MPILKESFQTGPIGGVIIVPKTSMSPAALPLENGASAVGQNRTSHGPGFERDHGQGFIGRRHGQSHAGTQGMVFFLFGYKSQMPDSPVFRYGQNGLPGQEKNRVRPPALLQEAKVMLHQCHNAFVGINAPQVKQKGSRGMPRYRARLRLGRDLGTHTHHNPRGGKTPPGNKPEQITLLFRVVENTRRTCQRISEKRPFDDIIMLYGWNQERLR